MQIALIQPPVTRATEPPIGIARLQAALKRRSHSVAIFDANVEAQRWLINPIRLRATLEAIGPAPTKRGQISDRRAVDRAERSVRALELLETYRDHSRYTGAARDIAAAFRLASRPFAPARITATDFAPATHRELRPADIHAAANDPNANPFAPYLRDDLLPRVISRDPRVIGLSVSYAGQLHAGLCLAGMLRDALPNAHLVLGGSLVTSWLQALPLAPELAPLIAAAAAHFDTLVQGEGEAPLLALVEAVAALPRGQTRLTAPPPGCIQHSAHSGLSRGTRPALLALDEVAHADFSGFPLSLYLSPRPTLPIVGSRGCYWHRCAFCPESAGGGVPFSPRTAHALVAEMTSQHQAHGVEDFHLVDDAIPPRVMQGIAQELKKRGLEETLRWSGFARAERSLTDPTVCRTLAAGGLRMLELGVESGSDRLLRLFKKGVPVAQARAALKALHGAGIGTYAYILFGIPSEIEAEARETLELVSVCAEEIDFLHTSIMRLTRDTVLESDARRFGIHFEQAKKEAEQDERSTGRPLHRGFTASTGMSAAEVRHFVDRVYRGDPKVREIEKRTPDIFGAGHAVFRLPPSDKRDL